VTELAGELDIHKSTAHRLLATLKDRGLVEQDPSTELYRLGMGMVLLAGAVTAELDIVRTARPICQQLSRETQETVTITVLEGDDAVIIDQVSSPSSVVSVNWTGQHTPLHCTSDGKVLLAHLPPARQQALLARPLRRYTERTIVDPAALLAQLEAIRRAGYGFTVGELEIGLNAVAAPIRSSGGAVIASVGISGPSFRVTAEALPTLGRAAIEAAAAISRRMGFEERHA
jgi:DNA-binding IclR family transcriptional regulator